MGGMGGGRGVELMWAGRVFVCVFTLNHSALNASLRRLSVGICPPKRHVFFAVWEFSCHPPIRALTWRRLPFWENDTNLDNTGGTIHDSREFSTMRYVETNGRKLLNVIICAGLL